MSDHRDLVGAAARRLAAAGIDSPRLDARLLWEHANKTDPPLEGGSKANLSASENSASGRGRAEGAPERFASLLARRLAREPLAYITGRKEFWSLSFDVGPGVLVPRPETETIVEQAITLLPDRAAPLRLLDLGTGTGCLLVALLKEFPNARGLGVDTSEEARDYAQRNLVRHGLAGRGEVRSGSWGEDLEGPFDLIVSNPPYIKSADIETLAPEVARFEPRLALDGGCDGLDALRALAPQLARLLAPAAIAVVEIGAGAAGAASAMTQGGLSVVRTAPDLAGIPRVLVIKPRA